MVYKSSLLVFLLAIGSILLAACFPTATTPPPSDQHSIETFVAATVDAASTETQLARINQPPSATLTPTSPQVTVELPTATATPTPVPSPSPTSRVSPRYSVAYIKDGNVWLWTGGKDTSELTDTHDVIDLQISNDGELIAFKRQDPDNSNSQSLWVISSKDTSNLHTLVSSAELAELMPLDPGTSITGIGILNFVWRPDTNEVAYNTLLLHEGPGFGPMDDLYLVNADTLAKTTLLKPGQGGMFYYSPDGNQIALSNPDSLSLINADGSNPRQGVLTYPTVDTHSDYFYYPHPLWASDSESLRVAIPPKDTLARPLPPTGLWSIPVDGSPAVLLANIQAIPFAWPDNAFAPDFTRVIYVLDIGGEVPNQRTLQIVNPDGTNDTVYDQGESLEFTSWAPDSQHFIYLINSGDNQGVYIGGISEQKKQIATDPRSIINIQWMEGSQFACLVRDGDQWSLRILNLNGDVLSTIDTLAGGYPAYDALP